MHGNGSLSLRLSAASGAPFYDQIVEAIKKEISDGRLSPGDPLPSFRQLAADLVVSVFTVKRAYEELEREGIIYRRQGLGTFVAAKGDQTTRKAKLDRANELLDQAILEAGDAGLSDEEFLQLAARKMKQKEKR